MSRLSRAVSIFALVLLIALAACESIDDEGARFGRQLASEAQALKSSSDTERVFTYTPAKGADQTYKVLITPESPQSGGLVGVWVQKGQGGSSSYPYRYMNAQQRFEVSKDGAPVTVKLVKTTLGIEVADVH